jgi:hypothetical protein
VHPPLGEHLDGARLEPVADLLRPGRVIAGREAVGQLGEPDAGLERLALGPLVAVDPDLGRVGEAGADLDERRPEVLVPQVEVVAGHPAVGLRERVLRGRRLRVPLVGGPDPLEFLRDADRRHPGPPGGRLRCQVQLHHVDLAVVLAELHPGDPVRRRIRFHRAAEPGPDVLHQRGRRDRLAQVLRHERDHLPAGLQDGNVGVEVDTVQALDVQHRMPIQKLRCRNDTSHFDHQEQPTLLRS